MGDFLISYKKTSKNEGGFTIDNGGMTVSGISRNANPSWKFWPLIDQWIKDHGRPHDNFIFTDQHIPGITEGIQLLYKKHYWDPLDLDNEPEQDVCDQAYDEAVNAGDGIAEKELDNLSEPTA